MKLLQNAVADGFFLLDLEAWDMRSVFHQTLDHVVAHGLLEAEHRDEVEEALLERKAQASTAIGHSLAVAGGGDGALAEPRSQPGDRRKGRLVKRRIAPARDSRAGDAADGVGDPRAHRLVASAPAGLENGPHGSALRPVPLYGRCLDAEEKPEEEETTWV